MVDCPSCQKPTLYLYEDFVTDGIWLHCTECKSRADIITCGAQIWNTSRVEALSRFVELGVTGKKDTDRLSGEYIRAWNRIETAEAFWSTVSSQLWSHGDDIIAVRLRELGLDKSIDACTGLIGVAHPDQVAEFSRAMGRAVQPRMREHGPSLVLPFYDLPGRITGYLIVQYDDKFMTRRTFVPVSGHLRRSDAGYYMLDTVLLPPTPALRSSYFVMDDPFWVLKSQCTQLKAGLPLLPLAASYSGTEAVSAGLNWQSFAATPRLFHSATHTADVISQASTARGYVCVLPSPTIERASLPTRTLQRLAAIRREAQPWQAALKTAIQNMSEPAAQAFVTKLTMSHEKLQQFFNANRAWLSTELGARLLNRANTGPALPTKVVPRRVIIERDGGWWTHTGVQVCNAQPKITKVIQAESGERMYAGIVRIGNRELVFSDSAEKIERIGLLAYAAQLAAAEGLLVVFDRQWNAKSYLVSLQLHPPELVHVSGKLGWHEQTHEFAFYGYSLTNDGAVKPSPYPEINRERRCDFPAPTPVAPLSIRRLLTPSHENALIWTAFAAIAADLVAPILNRDALPTACSPRTFGIAQAVGQALSCAHEKLTLVTKTSGVIAVSRQASAADWPVFVSHVCDDANVARGIVRIASGPLLVRVPEIAAAVAPGYGWQALRGDVDKETPDLASLRYVLPTYIQRLLERRMAPVIGPGNLTALVLADLAAWLKDIYSTTFNLPCALNRFITPDKAHELLMTAVDIGISAGKLDVLPRPRRKDQAKNFLLRNKAHWWLNQPAIDRYCIAVGSPAPNWLAIVDALEKAGVMRGENTVHKMPGLLVDRAWADQFWSDYTTPEQKELG